MDGREIRVVIIDDGEPVRRALRLRLWDVDDIRVVGEASTVAEAARKVKEECPDVALLSGTSLRIDWGEAVRQIKQQCRGVKVLVLASYEQDAAPALGAGASAHLLKESDVGVLAQVIRRIVDGG